LENQVIELDTENEIIGMEKVAVVMALYYKSDMKKYLTYLSCIPKHIQVFIISSNQLILTEVAKLKTKYKNLNVLEKDNRGRDLSALLVAFRPYIKDFGYLCFLHDKKSKHISLNEDLNFWIENLWGNMLYSDAYIRKVISMLRDEEYGLLLPPKPIGIHNDSFYADPWDNDYENVVQLAHMLHIEMPVRREDVDLVSLGSVFWCRTNVLQKVFTYNWEYTDFPEEPMSDDGTISHALERIFGFAAVDAGYKVKTIMNAQYASKLITILQEKLQYTYDWLWKKEGVKNTYQLSKLQEEKTIVSKIFEKGEVYLYGAGDYGIQYLKKLLVWGYKPKAFVVSEGQRKNDVICGFKVYELSEVENDINAGFIITTNPGLQEILSLKLEQKGIFRYYKGICL
jgi:lipopolysaccharide biosynthesis protein